MAQEREPQESIMIRVPPETFRALQLAQPFVHRRSMQDLIKWIIDDFLVALRERDEGYAQATRGLMESQARTQGALAKRSTRGHTATRQT